MERIPYGKCTKEFRAEAVKIVIKGGLSVLEAGRRLSLAPSTLSHWVRAYKSGKLAEVGSKHRPQFCLLRFLLHQLYIMRTILKRLFQQPVRE